MMTSITQLSFIPDAPPPRISNFPLHFSATPPAASRLSSFSLFSSSSNPKKLTKPRPEPTSGPSPPSAYKPPPSSFSWLRRKSSRVQTHQPERSSSAVIEISSRGCATELGHGSSTAFTNYPAPSLPRQRLSLSNASRLKKRGLRSTQSETGHATKYSYYVAPEPAQHPSWAQNDQLSPVASSIGCDSELFSRTAYVPAYSSEESSCSSVVYCRPVRPSLVRRDADLSSSSSMGPSIQQFPPALKSYLLPPAAVNKPLPNPLVDSPESPLTESPISSDNIQDDSSRQSHTQNISLISHHVDDSFAPITQVTPFNVHRRKSIAIAMADDSVTDEVLVETLEQIHLVEGTPGVLGATCVWGTDDVTCLLNSNSNNNSNSHPLPLTNHAHPAPTPQSLPELIGHKPTPWPTARRALLAVRELVRTERHYVSSLRMLLEAGQQLRCTTYDDFHRPDALGGSHTLPMLRTRGLPTLHEIVSFRGPPPPPLMLQYVRSLLEVGERLVEGFENDMSVGGVSNTFKEVMSTPFIGPSLDELAVLESTPKTGESAYVAWCGVVGTWFAGNAEDAVKPKPRKLSRSSLGRASTKRRSNTTDGSTTCPSSPTRNSTFTMHHITTSSPSVSSNPPTSGLSVRVGTPSRPSVRDIAILPTQRVMRYVLVFRDILSHTPSSSPAREMVNQAVDSAVALAGKCDRAQGNIAFLMQRNL